MEQRCPEHSDRESFIQWFSQAHASLVLARFPLCSQRVRLTLNSSNLSLICWGSVKVHPLNLKVLLCFCFMVPYKWTFPWITSTLFDLHSALREFVFLLMELSPFKTMDFNHFLLWAFQNKFTHKSGSVFLAWSRSFPAKSCFQQLYEKLFGRTGLLMTGCI